MSLGLREFEKREKRKLEMNMFEGLGEGLGGGQPLTKNGLF